MSMTQEEAIELLRDTPIDIRSTREDDIHTLYATAQMMAIDALLPITREQVEKVWRGEWVKCKHADYYVCNKCSTVSKTGEDEFCKSCGAPMTDEAVEITMRRLEALNEED